MKKLITFLATGAYVGFSPVAPGTFGSLWGVLMYLLISPSRMYMQAGVILAAIIASIYLSGKASMEMRGHDNPAIVCDETAGMLVSLFLVPTTYFGVILAFLLFRFFDILKPYPIGHIDRRVGGGLGITLDDVTAGICANVATQVILWLSK